MSLMSAIAGRCLRPSATQAVCGGHFFFRNRSSRFFGTAAATNNSLLDGNGAYGGVVDLNYAVIHPSVPSSTEAHTPVLFLHGLFGSCNNLKFVAKAVGDELGQTVAVVDMRNHGASPHRDTMSYPQQAADIAHLIATQFDGGPVDIVGHSMGGKAAMMLALNHSELIRKLIVVDIAPVPYNVSQEINGVLSAMQSLPLDGSINTTAKVVEHLQATINNKPISQFAATNFVRGKKGTLPRWRLNIDVIAKCISSMRGFPIVEKGISSQVPTLFLHGSKSNYVIDEYKPIIASFFPNHSYQSLEAGHWVHAEKKDEFIREIVNYLGPQQ
eukprot:m.48320 g.48320  ORF g.48320 m.48320 type:complete len:328 (+) comp7390_c0_seq1:99-1082(+)